jgi:hypothetical protein
MDKSNLRGWKYRAVISYGAGQYTETICPAFSLKELAEYLKMKVTPHFRKRVKQLAREGLYIEQRVYAGKRGMQIIYYKAQKERLDM